MLYSNDKIVLMHFLSPHKPHHFRESYCNFNFMLKDAALFWNVQFICIAQLDDLCHNTLKKIFLHNKMRLSIDDSKNASHILPQI